MSTHAFDVAAGERFKFGENWSRFLKGISEAQIVSHTNQVRSMLEVHDLDHKTFLDIGSGSGLTSLAALRLGARVRSFDYDPKSVECTRELHRRYAASTSNWTIHEGSVLDKEFLNTLGEFDVVCSWGVLHHTGSMWTALENAAPLVKVGGKLFIAIYNDQGPWSNRWLTIKKIYNKLPKSVAAVFATIVMGARELRAAIPAVLRGRFGAYLSGWTQYRGDRGRGMSKYYDLIDWVGGYPFEVAKPEQILDFYRQRGFVLEKLVTCAGGLGCNEYVFLRTKPLD